MPENATNLREVLWFQATALEPSYSIHVQLLDGTADDLPVGLTAGEYVAALAILADPHSKFLTLQPKSLSAGSVPTTKGSLIPQDSDDQHMISSYMLKWDFTNKKGEIQIRTRDDGAVSLQFPKPEQVAQFAAICMTLRIPGRTAYINRTNIITTTVAP